MVLALDISNYTTGLTAPHLADAAVAGVGVVIVQAFPAYHRNYPTQLAQMRLVRDSGLALDCYIYDYLASPDWRDSALAGLYAYPTDRVIRRIWADEEDVTLSANTMSVAARIAAIRATLTACDLYPTLLGPTGVYSGAWWWRPYTQNYAGFADRPLWDSNYDHIADTKVDFHAYGGWVSPTVKQDVGTSSFANIGGLDQSVLSDAEARTLILPTPEVPMSIHPGDGMIAQMHAHGDAPLFGHRFWAETDDDGAAFSVEECFGAQGRYVSSNASGSWVNAGPF